MAVSVGEGQLCGKTGGRIMIFLSWDCQKLLERGSRQMRMNPVFRLWMEEKVVEIKTSFVLD